jgi:hypothetical protein
MYDEVCKLNDKYRDVSSRQVIVIDQAIMDAHEMGIDWFATLDIDECMYVSPNDDCSARRYLGSKPRSVECVRLWNHEAVPESTECQDWFRENTLFKINRQHCKGFQPRREYDELLRRREGRELEPEQVNSAATWWSTLRSDVYAKRLTRGAASIWRSIATKARGSSQLVADKACDEALTDIAFPFIAYDDGRSIVRLEKHLKPPLPYGPRSFLTDNGQLIKNWYQASSPGDAVVLHYPNASFSHWREKYQALGELTPASRGTPPVHVASSEVVLSGDTGLQARFFRTVMMHDDHNELAFLAEHGLVQRVTGVRNLLNSWDAPINQSHEDELLPGRQRWLHPSGLELATPNR